MSDVVGELSAGVPSGRDVLHALKRNQDFVGMRPVVIDSAQDNLGLQPVGLEEVRDEKAKRVLKGLLYERPDVKVFQVVSGGEQKIALVIDHRDKGADFGATVVVNYWGYTDHLPQTEVGAEEVYISCGDRDLSIRSLLPPFTGIKMRYAFWREPPDFSTGTVTQEGKFAIADNDGMELWLSEIVTGNGYHGVRHELGHLWADYLGLDLGRQRQGEQLSDQEIARLWMLSSEHPANGLVLPSGKMGREAIMEVSYSERLAEVIAYVLLNRGREAGFTFGQGSRSRGEKGLQYYDAFYAPFILQNTPNPQEYFASRRFRTERGIRELRAIQQWLDVASDALAQPLQGISPKVPMLFDGFQSDSSLGDEVKAFWVGTFDDSGHVEVVRFPAFGPFPRWGLTVSTPNHLECLTWSNWDGMNYLDMGNQHGVSVTNLNDWSSSQNDRLFLGKKIYEFVGLLSRTRWRSELE